MKIFDSAMRWTILVAFTGLLLFSLMNVVNRFIVFRFNTGWTEELARYFSVYVVFFGAALTTKNKAHPYIGIVLTAMRRSHFWLKLAPFLEWGILLLETAVLIFIIVKGVEVVSIVHMQTAPASQISMAWPYSAIPIGAASMLWFHKDRLFRRDK
jgi:TRAP-type C4-dicarboxylate transport system permease small subunit